jgi:hypothetical protein
MKKCIPRVCQYCGRAFLATRQQPGKYCSRSCARRGRTTTRAEHFWSRVARTDDLFSCWEWQGPLSHSGYGQMNMGRRGSRMPAHRFSWELHYGPIPECLFCCHHCDNPICVRPDHLFLGTLQENLADMRAKGREARGLGHGMTKLTEAQVREIRRRYAEGGISMRALGAEFGICAPQVCEIVNRKKWAHLE